MTMTLALVAASVAGISAAVRQEGEQPTTSPQVSQRIVTDPGEISRSLLPSATGGPASGRTAEGLEPVALFHGPLPTVFAFTAEGRLFVAFPRWGLPTNYTAAEVKDGRLVPFPSAEANWFDPQRPERYDPRRHLVSVQSVVVDSADRVWLVDTGSINMQPPIPGAPKLWAYDPKTGQRVKEIDFAGSDVIRQRTYLNDVCFELSRGEEGFAFITDSGEGGIIVVDLASGQVWRKLDGHESVRPDQAIELKVEGEALKMRPPGSNEEKPVLIASDGIALSPDGRTLYYTPLTSRDLWAVEVDALVDRDADAAATVRRVARKPSANDGMVCDADGRIYTTDFEDNAIRRFDPAGRGDGGQDEAREDAGELLMQDARILWPDCVIVRDGYVYFTANQLNRQPQFHRGDSRLEPPLVLFRFKAEGAQQVRRG